LECSQIFTFLGFKITWRSTYRKIIYGVKFCTEVCLLKKRRQKYSGSICHTGCCRQRKSCNYKFYHHDFGRCLPIQVYLGSQGRLGQSSKISTSQNFGSNWAYYRRTLDLAHSKIISVLFAGGLDWGQNYWCIFGYFRYLFFLLTIFYYFRSWNIFIAEQINL